MHMGFLEQYVEKPTKEQAILDWVLGNEKGLVGNLVEREPLGTSDHNMVEFFVKVDNDVVDSETSILNLNKGNMMV